LLQEFQKKTEASELEMRQRTLEFTKAQQELQANLATLTRENLETDKAL